MRILSGGWKLSNFMPAAIWSAGITLVWWMVFPGISFTTPGYEEFLPAGDFSGTLTATLRKDFLSGGHYGFVADDCVRGIRIDGRLVASYECRTCDHCAPTVFKLPPEVPSGTHAIEIDVSNTGGLGHLRFPTHSNTLIRFLVLLWAGAFALVRRKGTWIARGILLISLGIAFFYSVFTPLFVRSYDLGGHSTYIQHLRSTLWIPDVEAFWESFQPPFYYALMAVLGGLGIKAPDLAFAFFALTLVWFSIRFPYWIGIGFLGLLPASVYFTSRMSNDVIFPFYGLAFILFLEKIDRKESRMADSVGFGIVLGLAMMTKMSALAFFPALIPTVFRRLRNREWKSIALISTPALAFASIWLFRSYLATGDPFFADILGEEMRVPNGWNHFFGFDLPGYFREVAVETRIGTLREQLVPFLLVSALQGEFKFPEAMTSLLMIERGLLLIFFTGAILLLFKRENRDLLATPAFCLVGGQLLFYLTTNIRVPFTPIQDARYWGIAFPALAFLTAELYRRVTTPVLKTTAVFLCAGLFGSFTVFYLNLLYY